MISNEQQTGLDEKMVLALVSGSLMCRSFIVLSVGMLNTILIGSPLAVLSEIIDKYLPTNYRYPSVRYYKSILSHTAVVPADYFVNRF